ncbi:MAG: DUF2927 domain-containing protein [Rhodobacteraceae bacterium]|nr:DUF2927 domain-containing protein [Paracoccaceae bacterium]
MVRIGALLLALGLVGGCATVPPAGPSLPPVAQFALPPMRTFGRPEPSPPQRSNEEIARDFLDLTFELENGESLPVFTRFDEPVTIALTGDSRPIFDIELDRLIDRMRSEAGIDIRRTDDPATAAIVVEAISSDDLRHAVPSAACFVLPRRITWADFRANMRRKDLDWGSLRKRDAATIFVPADVSPQEVRDCLHEETAQALGPVNDLYRLEDSIFNDDNMHSVLTGFDMIVLRAAYDPALQDGMTRDEVAARLPAILARINPRGERYATRPLSPTPREWKDAIDGALTLDRGIGARRQSSIQALVIAQDQGWQDTRLGLSLLTSARLASGQDGAFALEAFLKAREVYDSREATRIHAANVGIQIAAFALAAGDFETAIALADRYIPVTQKEENAALLADFLLVRAASEEALGKTAQAKRDRREGYGWARYGLRSDEAVIRRAAEIEALVPQGEA